MAGSNALNMAFDEPQHWCALGLPSGKNNSPHPFSAAKGHVSKSQPEHVAHAAQTRAALVGDVRREMLYTSPGALWAVLRAWSVLVTYVRRTTKQLPPPHCTAHPKIRLTQHSHLVQYLMGGAQAATWKFMKISSSGLERSESCISLQNEQSTGLMLCACSMIWRILKCAQEAKQIDSEAGALTTSFIDPADVYPVWHGSMMQLLSVHGY